MAWNFRSRPCLAVPPADSPSTRNSSQRAGSRSWQSASFPGSPPESSTPLRRVRSRRNAFRTRLRALSPHRSPFEDDLLHDAGVFVEVFAQFVVDELLHLTRDVAVEAALGLSFNYCGCGTLTLITAVQAFADIAIASQVSP